MAAAVWMSSAQRIIEGHQMLGSSRFWHGHI